MKKHIRKNLTYSDWQKGKFILDYECSLKVNNGKNALIVAPTEVSLNVLKLIETDKKDFFDQQVNIKVQELKTQFNRKIQNNSNLESLLKNEINQCKWLLEGKIFNNENYQHSEFNHVIFTGTELEQIRHFYTNYIIRGNTYCYEYCHLVKYKQNFIKEFENHVYSQAIYEFLLSLEKNNLTKVKNLVTKKKKFKPPIENIELKDLAIAMKVMKVSRDNATCKNYYVKYINGNSFKHFYSSKHLKNVYCIPKHIAVKHISRAINGLNRSLQIVTMEKNVSAETIIKGYISELKTMRTNFS